MVRIMFEQIKFGLIKTAENKERNRHNLTTNALFPLVILISWTICVQYTIVTANVANMAKCIHCKENCTRHKWKWYMIQKRKLQENIKRKVLVQCTKTQSKKSYSFQYI